MDKKNNPGSSTSNKPSALSKSASAKHICEMLDEALIETFPASDAIAISTEREKAASPNLGKSHNLRGRK